ncbi:hypothetical protein D027_4346A, partial [Vibrio parahaemolyticus 861]
MIARSRSSHTSSI